MPQETISRPRGSSTTILLLMVALLLPMLGIAPATAQSDINCEPLDTGTPAPEIADVPELPQVEVPEDATEVTFGSTLR